MKCLLSFSLLVTGSLIFAQQIPNLNTDNNATSFNDGLYAVADHNVLMYEKFKSCSPYFKQTLVPASFVLNNSKAYKRLEGRHNLLPGGFIYKNDNDSELAARAFTQQILSTNTSAFSLVGEMGNIEDSAEMRSQPFLKKELNKKEAAEAAKLLLAEEYSRQKAALGGEWSNKILINGKDSLKFEYKVFGEKPQGGRRLFISMHGGGNAEPAVNDQQWRNQIRLYTPEEGVYIAPRAPTNTWNLWHEAHIDALFDQLILAAVLFEQVDPNKVYLMGYSAGGDGVYQLAPRMADRFAAAAMMAGHPNETSPLGLRNIGFAIHMGALDEAYNRNEIARRWGIMLDSLQRTDTGGYKHIVQLHEGRGHWMNREDTVAVAWMASFSRNPIPNRIVWKQDDVHHLSSYWLAVPEGIAQTGGEIVATYKGNEVSIESSYTDSLMIRLNDNMMNLDKPVVVRFKGKEIFRGKVKRNLQTIYTTIKERKDPGLIFPVELIIVDGTIRK